MILAKYSIFDIHVALFKHEAKTSKPIYAVRYWRGDRKEPLFIHHSISYTRHQAFHLYLSIIAYLSHRHIFMLLRNYGK